MDSKDYYQPPAASAAVPEQFADAPMFALNGRIGRVRYLAYSFLGGLVMLLVGGFAIGVASAILGGEFTGGSPAATALFAVPYLALIAFQFALMVRRCHDIDVRGWLALLMFVPLLNFLLYLVLWLVPGTAGANRFGQRPRPPSTGLYVAAFGMPVMVLGILAAVALPAYNEYIENANIAKVNSHYYEGGRFVANEMRKYRAEKALGQDVTLPATPESWIALINPAGALAPGGEPAYEPGSDVGAETGVIGLTVTGRAEDETLVVTLVRGTYRGMPADELKIPFAER